MSVYTCKLNDVIFGIFPFTPEGLTDAQTYMANRYNTDLADLQAQYPYVENTVVTGVEIDANTKGIKICFLLRTTVNGIELNSSNESLKNFYKVEAYNNS
ncbi:hypothetical protein Hokovirus_1_234 [Hokovirus HKV1]|uniref:Uncharacterized protein n=1 Tax=Hokovirus HKV1 TaxID=1977638 RepID=A0A1V0SF63_9VIRU|nr:hypothetical protein Hokovirus_1_234 [Hokovirus HKV1]